MVDTRMTDQALKKYFDANVMQEGPCPKCGCPRSAHDWWVNDGNIKCRRCYSGIAMAQTTFGGQTICRREVWAPDLMSNQR